MFTPTEHAYEGVRDLESGAGPLVRKDVRVCHFETETLMFIHIVLHCHIRGTVQMSLSLKKNLAPEFVYNM